MDEEKAYVYDPGKKRRVLILALILIALVMAAYFFVFQGKGGTEGEDDVTVKTTLAPLTAQVYQERGAVYKYYDQVTFDDTLDTLTARFGQPTVVPSNYATQYEWSFEDGMGVVCVFSDTTGTVSVKALSYEDYRQLQPLSGARALNNVFSITTQMTYDTVRFAFAADGIETMRKVTVNNGLRTEQYLMLWVDDAGSAVMILFSAATNTPVSNSTSYQFVE